MYDQTVIPLQFTPYAANKLKYLMNTENKLTVHLRVYITGGGCSGFQYGFLLEENIHHNDNIFEKKGVTLVIDPMSLQYIMGSSVDYAEDLEGSRFIVINPNAKITCSCGASFSF